jgi:protocatechuate 4,5-dioxygenase, beta chain
MARIVGGIGISHSPSMGTEFDRGVARGWDPRWKPWFDGLQPVKSWLERAQPDHIVIVYNDHLNHFTFDAYPTFAMGVAERFPQADEGWGPRALPDLRGDTEFGWHMSGALVEREFDLTVCQEMRLDHGIYSWMPYLADPPWDVPVLPIAVNMLRFPLPSPQRLRKLGETIREAVQAYGDGRVVVIATGGMSHQIAGSRFGMANEEMDRWFLARLGTDLDSLVAIPQEELIRAGGTDAVELTMWYAMRAALPVRVRQVYDYYTFPQITGCGVVIFEGDS